MSKSRRITLANTEKDAPCAPRKKHPLAGVTLPPLGAPPKAPWEVFPVAANQAAFEQETLKDGILTENLENVTKVAVRDLLPRCNFWKTWDPSSLSPFRESPVDKLEGGGARVVLPEYGMDKRLFFKKNSETPLEDAKAVLVHFFGTTNGFQVKEMYPNISAHDLVIYWRKK